jgi:hypothetical protein
MDERLEREIAAAEAAHDAEAAGWEPPYIDPATISHPNFATSKLVQARLAAQEYEAIAAIAAEHDTEISSVIRAAVLFYLRDVEAGER